MSLTPHSVRLSRRLVIHSKDIEEITGYSSRGARNFLLQLKKKLGKSPKDFVFVHELSEYMNIEEERIRALLRLSLLMPIFLAAQFILFRDDMDLWLLWFVNFSLLKLGWPWFRKITRKLRLTLMGV